MHAVTRRHMSLVLVAALLLLASAILPLTSQANHSWGGYHWARTANPFTLKVGDSVSSSWDSYLKTAQTDWNKSTVLDLTIVAGSGNAKSCKGTAGMIEVCNSTYGNTGWLGIAQISISGKHITKGVAKMNDTYFNTAKYNTPEWKNLVMCQEIAHDFGLDHQDENFDNANLGTCMDYTSNPGTNQHPNAHDYAMLESIYSHADTSTTILSAPAYTAAGDMNHPSEWGRAIGHDHAGHPTHYDRDLGNGNHIFTFVIWVDGHGGH
jgi:hypothetical protein